MKKNNIFLLALFLLPLISSAQETISRIHEVGLNFNAPASFGIRYRSGSEKTLLRMTLNSISGTNTKSDDGSGVTGRDKSLGIEFNIGLEKRKLISNNLNFYYGSDLLTSYTMTNYTSNSSTASSKRWGISTGIGIVLGFLYKINSDLNISAEIVPSILYSYGESFRGGYYAFSPAYKNSGFNYGLNTTGVNLTMSFRFGKSNYP